MDFDGAGGAAVIDAGDTCGSLIAAYATAFAEARACNPLLSIVQCTLTASNSLQCPGCPQRVNDTARLSAIRDAYQLRTDCLQVPCPAFLCINPGTGVCQPNDSGSSAGSCADVP